MTEIYDAVVIGGGPGGALAAKKCAENGLKTILLEKKKMPRDKCCSGMVMGEWGQGIVEKEFGEYPDDVIRDTIDLSGYAFHVPGAEVGMLNVKTPATWRKTLDSWMCECAKGAGAIIRDSARVKNAFEADGQCRIVLKAGKESSELKSRYVIAADGANSRTRRSLFPDFNPVLMYGYRECYKVKLDIPEKRFNIFSNIGDLPLFFVHDKGEFMLLEGVAPKGMLKEVVAGAKQYLVENHGMPREIEPVWRDGCVEAFMFRELMSGAFRPAKGNVVLVGDAAGLNIPVTGEGLASSLKSGLDAAYSIIEAKEKGMVAEEVYLKKIDDILSKFGAIHAKAGEINKTSSKDDPGSQARSLVKTWDMALKLF